MVNWHPETEPCKAPLWKCWYIYNYNYNYYIIYMPCQHFKVKWHLLDFSNTSKDTFNLFLSSVHHVSSFPAGSVSLDYVYIVSVWPPPSNGDHQDYYMFSSGFLMNLRLPLLQGGGHTQYNSTQMYTSSLWLSAFSATLFNIPAANPTHAEVKQSQKSNEVSQSTCSINA